MADERIAQDGLTFRAGEIGFVFYDDAMRASMRGDGNRSSRTWAFGTIEEAAAWLVAQFPPAAPSAADLSDAR